MDKFQVLLRFAIAKRIRNKTFVGWNVLLFFLVLGVMFGDQLILQVSPDFFAKQQVHVFDMPDFVAFAQQQDTVMEFQELDDMSLLQVVLENQGWVVQKDEHYQVISNRDFSPMSWITLSHLLLTFEDLDLQATLSQKEYLDRQPRQVIPVKMSKERESSMNQTWAFLMITTIYFVALGYVGIAASDVVYEKSTRMMELILTCVSSTTHLIAKLLSSWLVLIFQVCLLGLSLIVAMLLRYFFDKGVGLFRLMLQLELIPQSISFDLTEVLRLLQEHSMIIPKLVVGLLFMLIGILFVQTMLVILSSFVGSIEESGTIQSPFYLLFMGVYYITIFLNTPNHMNYGVGKMLSMFPFFSMLFMPCRMFYYEVANIEVAISFGIALVSLIVLWVIGAPLYQIGVLDYSSQPMSAKIKSSFRILTSKTLFQR